MTRATERIPGSTATTVLFGDYAFTIAPATADELLRIAEHAAAGNGIVRVPGGGAGAGIVVRDAAVPRLALALERRRGRLTDPCLLRLGKDLLDYADHLLQGGDARPGGSPR